VNTPPRRSLFFRRASGHDRKADVAVGATAIATRLGAPDGQAASPRVAQSINLPCADSRKLGTGSQAPRTFWRLLMSEALQWTAAVVVLIAYGLSLMGVWSVVSYRYLALNLIGGFGLSAAAAISHQWGFVLLEGVWGAVAGWSIISRLRGRGVRIPAGLES
jgi:hypothetical protein